MVPAAGQRAGEGNGAGWVWSICLRNTFKKARPLQRSPFTCDSLLGGEGTKGRHLKTGDKAIQNLPDVLKASHIQNAPSNTAQHLALLVAVSGRCKIENGGGSGSQEWLKEERRSSTVSTASAPPLCLSHMGYLLVEHWKKTPTY